MIGAELRVGGVRVVAAVHLHERVHVRLPGELPRFDDRNHQLQVLAPANNRKLFYFSIWIIAHVSLPWSPLLRSQFRLSSRVKLRVK